MVERFAEALGARSDAMLTSTVAALREIYEQEVVMLVEECERQVNAAMATLPGSLHSDKTATQSTLRPISRQGWPRAAIGIGECLVSAVSAHRGGLGVPGPHALYMDREVALSVPSL